MELEAGTFVSVHDPAFTKIEGNGLLAMFVIRGSTDVDAFCSWVSRYTEAGKGTIGTLDQALARLGASGLGASAFPPIADAHWVTLAEPARIGVFSARS